MVAAITFHQSSGHLVSVDHWAGTKLYLIGDGGMCVKNLSRVIIWQWLQISQTWVLWNVTLITLNIMPPNHMKCSNMFEYTMRKEHWDVAVYGLSRRFMCTHQMAVLSCMKWRQGCHLESVTSNWKSSCQSMCIYLKNIPAKFCPDPVWNDKGCLFLKRGKLSALQPNPKSINWRSQISNMTSYFQDDSHDVICEQERPANAS